MRLINFNQMNKNHDDWRFNQFYLMFETSFLGLFNFPNFFKIKEK